MTTAKSCIKRGLRGPEPRRILRPFQVNGDQIFIGVGPDVGDAVGEFDGALWPEECSGELLAAVSAELDPHRVDLEIGLRTRQRGNVIGEGRRRIACGHRDGHLPAHSVRAAEGQTPRRLAPAHWSGFRDRQRDPRRGRIGHLSHGADADPGRLREADESIGRNVLRQRRLDPGSRCAVARCGLMRPGCGLGGPTGPGSDPVDGPVATRQHGDRRQSGHSRQRAKRSRSQLSHAKKPAPILFPRPDMVGRRDRR